MTSRVIIASVILLKFVSLDVFVDAYVDDVFLGTPRYLRLEKPNHYPCPSFKITSREISMSPFQMSTRLRRRSGRSAEDHPVTIFPTSLRTFSKLGLAVLPNNEICIGGRKLDGVVLPSKPLLQFKLMLVIAIWFSPCLQKETDIKRRNCFDSQMEKFYNKEFRRIFISLMENITKFSDQI